MPSKARERERESNRVLHEYIQVQLFTLPKNTVLILIYCTYTVEQLSHTFI